ncbi:UNVERIFIED_CONTAM: hypothetical protein Sradi_1186400 [Sesamum radiatum]|uniref:Uncharacterized protein n=1 Tax=Sesamum radiatum TaxID=300843 RepID=A0AAW2UKC0_SESRA
MSTEEKGMIISHPHHGTAACDTQAVGPVPNITGGVSSRIYGDKDASHTNSDPKRVNFVLTRSPSDSRLHGSSGPSSTKGKSSIRSILPWLSFKNRSSNSDVEKAANIDSGSSTMVAQDKLSISRSWSLSKIFTPRIKRTSSLPVTPFEISNPDAAHSGSINSHLTLDTNEGWCISRSLSVPVIDKEKGIQKMNSFFRVIPSTPRVKDQDSEVSTAVAEKDDVPYFDESCMTVIASETCLDSQKTMKRMVKIYLKTKPFAGFASLNYVKVERLLRWNVAAKVNLLWLIKNVPLNGLPLKATRHVMFASKKLQICRVWQDLPILVIVGMLAYFCFLEQLLARKMDSSAIAISIPFSCVLGLLSSVTSSAMVKRRFVWVYASIQFAIVVIFAHIFYNVVHVQAFVSILLSTFAGFGIAMSGTSILLEVLRWREQGHPVTNENEMSNNIRPNPSQAPPPSLTATPSHSSPRPHRHDVENPETSSGS